MLLVIDVGNTNITMGVFREDELLETFRLTSAHSRTSDEYGITISDLVEHRGIKANEINDVIISSVVPNVMYSLTSGIIKYFHTTPIIVGPGIKTGIRIVTENPKQMGADRIVDAVAAYELYGGPVLVVDFGTATTYDLIMEDGSLVAGVTSPGIRLIANALWQGTAQLPKFEIAKPQSILAKETITSMQAGLVYGYIGQTEYIIKKIQEEAGLETLKVVATGGLGKLIADETDYIQVYDNRLTLKGLRLIHKKNKG